MEGKIGGSAALGANPAVNLAASRSGAMAAKQSSSSAAAPVSFGSSWQSLLASLGVAGTDAIGTKTALQAAAPGTAAADGSASTTSNSARGATWQASLTTEGESEPASGIGQSATNSFGVQALAGQLTSAATRQTVAKAGTKTSTTEAATDRSDANRTTSAAKNAKSVSSLTGAISEAIQSTQGSDVLVAPAPATAGPISSTGAVQTASSETDSAGVASVARTASPSSSGASADASPSSRSLSATSLGILNANEKLPGADSQSQAGKTNVTEASSPSQELKGSEASGQTSAQGESVGQGAAVAVPAGGRDSSAGATLPANSVDSQAVESTTTASSTGGTRTAARAQTVAVSRLSVSPVSISSSSALTDNGVASPKGDATASSQSASSQPASPLRTIVRSNSAGQPQSPDSPAVQSQSASVGALSMGSGSSDSIQVQAGTGSTATTSTEAAVSTAAKGAAAEKSRGLETLRPSREAGKSSLTQQGSQIHGTQTPTSGGDATAMVRDPAGIRGASSTTGDAAKEASSTASGSSLKETFDALDTEGGSSRSTWTHAGTQRAEAGIQDPELGWVGVRADLGSGGVHASLVPGSADAAQALGSHLAGLNSYLTDHHTPVETLTLAAPETGWSGSGADAGQGQADQSGRNADRSGEAAAASSLSVNQTSAEIASQGASSQVLEEMAGNTSAFRWGGTHISVLA